VRIPDTIEPVVGYRVWLVQGNRLFSFAHMQYQWEPHKKVEAHCGYGCDEVPGKKCSCGFYAAATFNRLFDMGYTKSEGMFSAPEGEITIAGQVNMWGGIVPGQYGWRAQFAYPKKLLIPYTLYKLAKPLSKAYDVPFKLYNLERKH